jgi:hypothetical protein
MKIFLPILEPLYRGLLKILNPITDPLSKKMVSFVVQADPSIFDSTIPRRSK